PSHQDKQTAPTRPERRRPVRSTADSTAASQSARPTAWVPPVIRNVPPVPQYDSANSDCAGESACATTTPSEGPEVTVVDPHKPEPARIAFVADLVPITRPAYDASVHESPTPRDQSPLALPKPAPRPNATPDHPQSVETKARKPEPTVQPQPHPSETAAA